MRLPYHLNSYPLDFFEYIPRFSGEDHISAEKHLEAFHNFIDNFEIVHEDVVLRLFSKSLVGDVALCFKNIEVGSIGSWDELYDVFSRYWGENRSFDQYFTNFCTLKRGKEEALAIFNIRFCSVYHSIPLDIKPTEIVAMVYYVMDQHSDLVLFLLERKSSSLKQLFEDKKGVEENIRACKMLRDQAHVEDIQDYE